MAIKNWAKIYFKNEFAGTLAEEPGGRCRFTYDETFRQSHSIGISINLPITIAEHIFENGLHPFFDNLVAEGWMAEIQAKALKTHSNNKFKLLLGFGCDLVGAVSVIDPDPQGQIQINKDDYLKEVAIKSKASMSGVQPKIFANKREDKFYPAEPDKASTHIAKLPGKYPLILENEYLCSLAAKVLLIGDDVVDLELTEVEGIGKALLVERFDRDRNGQKIHFEEFAQLLNFKADNKYDANYSIMADFINSNSLCNKIDLEKLFRRILACILLGNTDAHLKNFAMFYDSTGFRLTPVYDMVFSAYYDLNELALRFKEVNVSLGLIKAKHLINLCEDFKLHQRVLELTINDFGSRLEKLYDEIGKHKELNPDLRDKLIQQVKTRWNGTFKGIGKK